MFGMDNWEILPRMGVKTYELWLVARPSLFRAGAGRLLATAPNAWHDGPAFQGLGDASRDLGAGATLGLERGLGQIARGSD